MFTSKAPRRLERSFKFRKKKKMIKPFVFITTLFILEGLGIGCRPPILIVPSYIKTVGVAPVDNKTSWFGLDTVLTQNLITQFQQDGRLGIEDPDHADMVVKVIIRKYTETPESFDPKTNAVLQYLDSIDYDVVALDHVESKTLTETTGLTDSLYYYTTYNVGAIPQTRDQALLQLEQDMARLIVLRVMQGN